MMDPIFWDISNGKGPLYRRLADAIRDAIRRGELSPGERLPASRRLANAQGCSRNVVLLAYEQLAAEGYVEGRAGSGTYVHRALPVVEQLRAKQTMHPVRVSQRSARLHEASRHARSLWHPRTAALPYDFRYGAPSFGDVPLEQFRRIVGRCLGRSSQRALDYAPPQGSVALRRAIAGYVGRARGVRCSPEQIVVTQGSQQAFHMIAHTVLDPGSQVVVEDPGYVPVTSICAALGAEIVPCVVDEDGLVLDALEAKADADVRLAFVTPSHQFPSGATLSLPRRFALLQWAERNNVYLVEDDYDGEYRYGVSPIRALRGLGDVGCSRVFYVGTFSKSMFPALRVGYLIAPDAWLPHILAEKAIQDAGSPSLFAEALAEFIERGHLERHIRRALRANVARRDALLQAVQQAGVDVRVRGAQAGLHVVLEFPGVAPSDERHFLRLSAERGVGVYALGPFFAPGRRRDCAAYLLGYATLTTEMIAEGIRRFLDVMRG